MKCRDDLYTSDEDEIIRKYYPSLGLSKVRDMLPNRTETSIHQRASSLGVKYLTYNKDFFEKINTYEKAYWLGFIYADGYVTTNNRWGVSLGIEDIEHLEKLLSAFECNVKIRIRDKEEKFGYNSGARYKECSFLINNSKMHKDLINNGVIPNKTKKLAFPSKEVLPLELRSHFIRGYFDGDGSYVFYRSEEIRKDRNNRVYNRLKKEISLVCASYNFINSISEILRDECGINKRLFVTKRDNLHILRLQSKSDMKLFIDYVYKNSTVHLERKFKKAQEILEYCLT